MLQCPVSCAEAGEGSAEDYDAFGTHLEAGRVDGYWKRSAEVTEGVVQQFCRRRTRCDRGDALQIGLRRDSRLAFALQEFRWGTEMSDDCDYKCGRNSSCLTKERGMPTRYINIYMLAIISHRSDYGTISPGVHAYASLARIMRVCEGCRPQS